MSYRENSEVPPFGSDSIFDRISELTVKLHKLYKPGSCSKSPLIKLHDKFVQTSDFVPATTSKTAPKKLPETPF